ncbi:uncharacterized protein [Euphorbia lathyris]
MEFTVRFKSVARKLANVVTEMYMLVDEAENMFDENDLPVRMNTFVENIFTKYRVSKEERMSQRSERMPASEHSGRLSNEFDEDNEFFNLPGFWEEYNAVNEEYNKQVQRKIAEGLEKERGGAEKEKNKKKKRGVVRKVRGKVRSSEGLRLRIKMNSAPQFELLSQSVADQSVSSEMAADIVSGAGPLVCVNQDEGDEFVDPTDEIVDIDDAIESETSDSDSDDDIDLECLPGDVPYEFADMCRWANNYLCNGRTVFTTFEDYIFGHPVKAVILRKDIRELADLAAIGCGLILYYMRHLYDVIVNNDRLDTTFSLVDPNITNHIERVHKIGEKVKYLTERYEQSGNKCLYLIPRNKESIISFYHEKVLVKWICPV